MMWLVLSALRAVDPELFEDITWKLIWNSSEECFSPDFGDVCRAHFDRQTLAALVFESEGRSGKESRMVVARKGRGTWRVTVSGRGSHAGGKHEHGANAIVQLGRTVQRVAALTDYTRGLTVNVGTISGGTVLNRVPHQAVAEGEFRTFTPEAFAYAKNSLLALTGPGDVRSPADGYTCEIKVEILTESRPWPRNPGTDGLYNLWKQAGDELGSGGELRGARGLERRQPHLGCRAHARWPRALGRQRPLLGAQCGWVQAAGVCRGEQLCAQGDAERVGHSEAMRCISRPTALLILLVTLTPGEFSVDARDLQPGRTYELRALARDKLLTVYGAEAAVKR